MFKNTEVKWLTVREFGALFQYSTTTIYKLIRKGDIPSTKFGGNIRIPADAYERLAERVPVEATAIEFLRDNKEI